MWKTSEVTQSFEAWVSFTSQHSQYEMGGELNLPGLTSTASFPNASSALFLSDAALLSSTSKRPASWTSTSSLSLVTRFTYRLLVAGCNNISCICATTLGAAFLKQYIDSSIDFEVSSPSLASTVVSSLSSSVSYPSSASCPMGLSCGFRCFPVRKKVSVIWERLGHINLNQQRSTFPGFLTCGNRKTFWNHVSNNNVCNVHVNRKDPQNKDRQTYMG